MNSKHLGADYVFALDTAECAVMGAQGAVDVLYAKQISQLNDEEKTDFISKKVQEYQQEVVGYKEGLKKGYIDEIVQLFDLRKALNDKITKIIAKKRISFVGKKHGNIPL